MPGWHTEPRDMVYENTHRAYDYQFDDNFGIMCKNIKYCGGVLPPWWWECRNIYVCTNCDMLHGVIQEKEDECPVCLETTTCVVLPSCKHPICETCFKRCHFPKDPPQPEFPYSDEIQEAYDDDDDNPKWHQDYPLIKKWRQELERWSDDKEERFERESYLRVCALCRKK